MAERAENRSVDILVKKVENNSFLLDSIKSDPINTLIKVADDVKRENPPRSPGQDPFTFRVAVSVLAIVIIAVVGMIGYIYLQKQEALKVPEFIVALGSTALGALAGLVTPRGETS